MSEYSKSAIWALVSIPVTVLGFFFSFALAHGSLTILLPFLLPGFLVIWLLGENDYPEWFIVMLCLAVQYVSYFWIIHHGGKLLRKMKSGRS